jgi:2-keto-3-deoxy-L-rhamnonate aldolase RhmA
MVPQLGMWPTPAKVLNEAPDELTSVLVLLETPEGIANADAIAALDGVDILAIGANDLTAEIGVPGDYGDPRVRDAVATVVRACRQHGKLPQLGGISDLALVASLLPLGICDPPSFWGPERAWYLRISAGQRASQEPEYADWASG